MRTKKTPAERFFVKINFDGPTPPLHPDMSQCWLWTAGGRGYGQSNSSRWGRPRTRETGYGGFWDGERTVDAHVWMYKHAYGELEPGQLVNHKCHVTRCVNPAHLEAVPDSENRRDTARKAARRLERIAA